MLLRPASIPVSVANIFGNSNPLVMELGFGNGSFLIEQARKNPDKNFVGAERSLSSLNRALHVLRRSPLANVVLYPGDGRFVLDSLLERRSLSHLWVNFPDPWPRRRHVSRRLLDREFFLLVSDRLEAGGAVALTTDHADYFAFARGEAKKSGLFGEVVSDAPLDTLQTRYARKWAKQNKEFYHVVFTLEKAGPEIAPSVKLEEMQHAHLTGAVPSPESFEKIVYPVDSGKVVLLDIFRALDGNGLVFLVLVEEEGLRQELLFELKFKGGTHQLFVRRFGQPLPTEGVSQALGIVLEWLVAEGMEVTGRWY